MKKIYFVLIALMFAFSGCGIEGFEPIVDLKPPLGLEVKIIDSEIYLQFWGLNDEEFFSGYNIYVAESAEDLRVQKGVKYPNADHREDKPTLWKNIRPVKVAKLYSFTVTEDYLDGESRNLIEGKGYNFYVKAYSEQYMISSPPSNIDGVNYTTSTSETNGD
jgi:hypothetical protein